MSNELPNQKAVSGHTANDESEYASLNRPVFIVSTLIIAVAILYTCLAGESAEEHFKALQDGIIKYAGWYYILAVAAIVVVTIFVCVSRYGNIRLGPDHSRPDYGYISWFAMLFSAGMGIGLMFFGVAEPVMHFLDPPLGEGGTQAAAREAMNLTFFHWGIQAWAIYAIVALVLAFFSFRHGLPLTLRSAFYPIIGDRIRGPIGHAVDIFAVIGTLFGVATSLGFGVQQVNSGLHYVFSFIPEDVPTQMILIVAVTALATLSVASGLDRGVKLLSQLNITLAIILLIFILAAGSTVFLLEDLMQNIGTYLSSIVQKTFNMYAYNKTDWIGGWTIFYWGWWLSWSPFVGLFIAKISRGRTIREFIVGVLFVPTGFTFLWMTFFGNSAIDFILGGDTHLGEIVKENTPVALFEFLSHFPLSSILTYVALLMVVVFFVTSADSGALVMDMLCSHGKTNRKIWYRIFWSVGAGVVAMVLLWFGGLESLQTMAIASALPFVTVLMIAIWGFFKAIRVDDMQQMIVQQNAGATLPPPGSGKANWRERLQVVIHHPDKQAVEKFVSETCWAACQEVAAEFNKNGITAKAEREGNNLVKITTSHGEEQDFVYAVIATPGIQPTFIDGESATDDNEYYRAEVHLSRGGLDYDIMGWSQDGIMNDIVEQYQKHLFFLNSLRSS